MIRSLRQSFPEREDYPEAAREWTEELYSEIDPEYAPPRTLVELEAAVAPTVANALLRWSNYRCADIVTSDSPLEPVMALALSTAVLLETSSPFLRARCRDGKHWEERPQEDYVVSICGQHVIGEYRADFFLTGYDCGNAVRSVAVEVDGHEFHERTKEQARRDRTRDRTMQKYGFTVFRFTGSEVYADPIKCAKEAVIMALARVGGKA